LQAIKALFMLGFSHLICFQRGEEGSDAAAAFTKAEESMESARKAISPMFIALLCSSERLFFYLGQQLSSGGKETSSRS
jgi:hypothetical protein